MNKANYIKRFKDACDSGINDFLRNQWLYQYQQNVFEVNDCNGKIRIYNYDGPKIKVYNTVGYSARTGDTGYEYNLTPEEYTELENYYKKT